MEITTSAGPAHVDLELPAAAPPKFLIACTHGAGGTPDTKDVLAVKSAAEALGAATALVTQPYRVRGARAPGSAVKQDAAWTEIVAELRRQAGGAGGDDIPLVQCGRSNGARVACRTARDVRAAGVIALAFPLHPPGKPENTRIAELSGAASAGIPVLVVNGDRDPFGVPVEETGTQVVVLPGETHALTRNPAVIGDIAAEWLRAVLP